MGIRIGRRKPTQEQLEAQDMRTARSEYASAYQLLYTKVKEGEQLRKSIERDGGHVDLPAFASLVQARTEILDDNVYRTMYRFTTRTSKYWSDECQVKQDLDHLHTTFQMFDSISRRDNGLYEYYTTTFRMNDEWHHEGTYTDTPKRMVQHIQRAIEWGHYPEDMLPKNVTTILASLKEARDTEAVDLSGFCDSFEKHVKILDNVHNRYENEAAEIRTMTANVNTFVATVDAAVYELGKYRINYATELEVDDMMERSLLKSADST